MAVTINDIITELNTIIGDASTDRISAAERLQFVTQAAVWIKEETLNDHEVNTYQVNYYDSLSYYKLNNALSDLLEGNDLRKPIDENDEPFTRKDSQEVSVDIAQRNHDNSYAIERRNGDAYLIINHLSKYRGMNLPMDSLTSDGTWEADTTTSDALNLAIDDTSGLIANGSFVFDIDVSQSVNNLATILNSTMSAEDLTDDKDLSSWLLDILIPNVTYVTSVTMYWGTDSSNYYSVTATTDAGGNSFVANEVMTLKFDWSGATVTGTPDPAEIAYIRYDLNYSASQADMSSVRLGNARIVRPEKLTFYYTSWNVGTNTGGADIKKFTATSDVPYYSGQYDGYQFAHAHKAASLAYRSLRLYNESNVEAGEALTQLNRINNIIPKSFTRETKSFKVKGLNFRRSLGARTLRGFY